MRTASVKSDGIWQVRYQTRLSVQNDLLTETDNLRKVLETAIAEHNVPLAAVSLPPEFYDMQYVALDIYEALRVWAETSEPTTNLQAVLIPLQSPIRDDEQID